MPKAWKRGSGVPGNLTYGVMLKSAARSIWRILTSPHTSSVQDLFYSFASARHGAAWSVSTYFVKGMVFAYITGGMFQTIMLTLCIGLCGYR